MIHSPKPYYKMAQKIDISHVIKFDETFYKIWVHRLTLIFKAKKLCNIINGIIQKLIAPIVAQIIVGTPRGASLGFTCVKRPFLGRVVNNCPIYSLSFYYYLFFIYIYQSHHVLIIIHYFILLHTLDYN